MTTHAPMQFRRTFDPDLIRRVIMHPKISKWMFEDGAEVAETIPTPENVWYVCALDGRKLIGLFAFEPRTSVKYMVHVAIAPDQWARATEAFKGVIDWAWQHIGMERIGGEIPADNAHALRLAKKAGFALVGTEPGAFRRGGELRDIRIVSLGKEAQCPSVH